MDFMALAQQLGTTDVVNGVRVLTVQLSGPDHYYDVEGDRHDNGDDEHHYDVDAPAKCGVRGRTRLHEMCMQCAHTHHYVGMIVRAVREKPERVHQQDHERRTPLHEAMLWGAPDVVVRALIDAGADPHARDFEGNTPMDLA